MAAWANPQPPTTTSKRVGSMNFFVSEILGTMVLIILGGGVVANNILNKSKGNGGGWVLITFGWGFAVFAAVYVAFKSGAHLNPAVTLGLLINGATEYAPGVDANFGNTVLYILAQLIGAFIGAVIVWLVYRDQFDATENQGLKLAVFSTGPEVRNTLNNLIAEIVGTFILVLWVCINGSTTSGLGPLGVALIVVAVGMSLGGPTGYAINPARDLGPRIAHALLPIKGKGTSDWGYAWIPVAGPIIGGILAGLVGTAIA